MSNQVTTLEMDKSWEMYFLGRTFAIHGAKDMHNLLKVKDKYIKKFGQKRYRAMERKYVGPCREIIYG